MADPSPFPVSDDVLSRPDGGPVRVPTRRRAGARPWGIAAAVYALLALVMVGQGLLPGRTTSNADYLWSTTPWTASTPAGVTGLGSNFELEDIPVQHEPFWRYTRTSFPRAQLWNPYVAAGRPFLANGQSAPYSPFLLPLNAPVVPFSKALAVAEVIKLWVAALAMFAFAHCTLGLRFGGALVAGLVYGFAVYMVVWLPYPLTNVFPLIPLALLLAERIARAPGPGSVAGLAAVFGTQLLGGHPESCFHLTAVLIGFYVLVAFVHRRRRGWPWRALLVRTGAFAAALGLGAALAAVALVPFLELLTHSSDLGNRVATNPGHLEPRFLGALFLNDYWGRATQSVISPFLQNRGFYAGAITLMLAAAAVIARPRSIARLAVVVLGAVSLDIALGLPPLFDLVTALPGFRTTHNARLALYFLLALALLAGWGFDDLSGPPLSRRRARWATGAALAILCVPLVWVAAARSITPLHLGWALKVAWGFQDMPSVGIFNRNEATAGPVIRLSALLEWLPLAAIGVTLIALRLRSRLSSRVFLVAAVLLLGVDLLRAGMGFN
jgi:hypothetical protein